MASEVRKEIDINGLRRLYNADPCARALLDYVGTRKNNSVESSVDRFEKVLAGSETDCSRRQIVAVLKELARFNCGVFVIGRRGQPSRFAWSAPMVDTGRAARGEESDVQSLSKEAGEPLVLEESEPSVGTIRHSFNLRPDYIVVVHLPADLNTKEASRLAEFVRTLPFDDSASA